MKLKAVVISGCLLVFAAIAAVLTPMLLDRDSDRVTRERARRVRAHTGAPDPLASLPVDAEHPTLPARLAKAGFDSGARIFIRIFKLDFELEVWLQRNGRFERFATYPICRWSGQLGPKIREEIGRAHV